MSGRYTASARLESIVLERAVPHVASESAPSSWKALQKWGQTHVIGLDVLPVYDGGSELTIYSSDVVNFAFRAWHDSIHLACGIGFTLAQELRVASIHVQSCRDSGLNSLDCEAIWMDTAGQAWHYDIWGAYVHNQAGFVSQCLRDGIPRTCSVSWERRT